MGKSKKKPVLERMDKLSPGAQVWMAGDRDTWVIGTVTSRNGSIIKIKSDAGKAKLDLDDQDTKVYRANDRVVADMTSLSHFHLPGILHNLRERALQDEPYTFLGGSVLVAVNPLKRIEDPKGSLGSPSVVNVAHPYAIAEGAYQQLSFSAARPDEGPENQSIVVGGESGAGKTESSKYVLKHLVERGGGSKDDLDQRLLDSNPILEAFGNAATKRNPNSSRFGKFMKLHFKKKKKSRDLTIYGASVQTYLLERSRVTAHSDGERGYHVFYQLTTGADKSLRKKLGLEGNTFEYLKPNAAPVAGKEPAGKAKKGSRQSMRLPDLSKQDKENFKELVTALNTIGVTEGEGGQESLFSILAGLLHLGNVVFDENESGKGDEAKVVNEDVLETAGQLLGIKAKKLAALFIERKVKTVGEEIIAKRDAESAKVALDAVVKTVYTNTFNWLVKKITESLSENADYEDHPFIGVLDIFGFETFQFNDFEQLLINYTNEALQNTFNQQIFEAEAALYEREGLLVDAGDRQPPPNNEEAMVLLGGRKGDKNELGVLSIIDAETNAPQASDEKLVSNLHRVYKSNKLFPTPHPKDIKHCFIVKHYAGEVKYTVGKFIQKNVDKLPDEITSVLQASKMAMLQEIFEASAKKNSNSKVSQATRAVKKSTSTIAGKFKLQIETLIQTLGATKASFIRCIKPNARMERKSKDDLWFNNSYVMPQLVNLSIPQTAEVLQGGLPTRLSFDLLIESYQSILPKDAINAWETLGRGDERLFVKALFAAFDIPADTYKMGLTKVFFRAGMLEQLNEVLGAASSGAVDEEVVSRFRRSFSRALWRRAYAFVLAYNRFNALLEDSRNKKSAATILQRLARRRLEMLEAKAELERLRMEKRKREEEEARRKAKLEREKAAKLKKEQEKARAKKEKERIQLEQLKAEERARELEERATRAREEEEEAERHAIQLEKESNQARADEEAERAKTVEALGGEEAFEEQTKREKQKKTVRFAGVPEEDDDEEEEESRPAARSVAASPEAVERIKEKAKKQLRKSLAQKAKADYLDIAKPELFESVKFKEISTARPPSNPFACFSALLGGGKKKARAVDPIEDGDSWMTCNIIVAGIQLRYFEEIREDDNGEPVGKGQLGTVDIDPSKTEMAEVKGPGSEDGVVQFTVRSQQKQILFKLLDGEQNAQLMRAYDKAAANYKEMQVLSGQFERGDLGGKAGETQMAEYKQWLADKLISRAEFDILVNQQVSGLDEYVAQDVERFGEDAYADYRVVCEDCSEVTFVLPVDAADRITECPNCGCELPDVAELEAEAEAIRRQTRMREDEMLASERNGTVNNDYPVRVPVIDESKILFVEEPEVNKGYNTEQMSNTFNFTFGARLITHASDDRNGSAEEWTFAASWSVFESFHKLLTEPSSEVEHRLPDEYIDLIPVFPEDVERNRDKTELANQRLPLIASWMRELLMASRQIPPFFEIRFVRRFFNLPVDAKILSSEITNGPLSWEQMQNVQNLIDEMVAASVSGSKPKKESSDLVRSIFENIEATADPEAVFSSIDLAAHTDEEKIALITMATYTLDSIGKLDL